MPRDGEEGMIATYFNDTIEAERVKKMIQYASTGLYLAKLIINSDFALPC